MVYSKSKTLSTFQRGQQEWAKIQRGQQEWRKARACSKLRGWRGGGERRGFLRLLLNAPHHDRWNDGYDCDRKN